MADYKEVLREKAGRVRGMLAKHESKLDPSRAVEIKNLINNTFEITNGRLDALDYDVRNEGIMNYHQKLDRALAELSRFEERNRDDER